LNPQSRASAFLSCPSPHPPTPTPTHTYTYPFLHLPTLTPTNSHTHIIVDGAVRYSYEETWIRQIFDGRANGCLLSVLNLTQRLFFSSIPLLIIVPEKACAQEVRQIIVAHRGKTISKPSSVAMVKILMVHGFGVNAAIFETQTGMFNH